MKKLLAARLATLAAFCFFLNAHFAQAQSSGLKGVVRNQRNEILPFASVSVKGTSVGTIANEEGRYQLNLKPGYYEIVFQYLGHQAGLKAITIGEGMESFDAVLGEQSLELSEVKIGQGNEDPAYAIMRRAIAKSKFHLLQVDSYQARAYTKSSIVITDLPLEFLYKKQMGEIEKETNFKKGVPILNETVSDIEFKQPNIYHQKVVAARNSQDNNFVNPNEYLLSSFYKPDVVQTVSPLSPKAFGYYKFEYMGTFRENGVDVNKIKVIPRAYGDGVFKGTLHIIEELWAIHSLDLQTVKMGINLRVKQIYSPVQNVWMPIQQQFYADGGLYGLKGKADYVISQTFQSIKLNPNFPPDVVVLDIKADKDEIKTLPSPKKEVQNKELEELLSSGQKLSTKDLRKALKTFEKNQLEEKEEKGEDVDMVDNRITSTTIDSLATRRVSTFWDSLRTVPLTQAETRSYKRLDSLIVRREIETPEPKANRPSPSQDADTSGIENKTRYRKLQFGDVFWGRSFVLDRTKSWHLDYRGPVRGLQVNTVEGLAIDGTSLGIRHIKKADSKSGIPGHTFNLKGIVRYSLERNLISPRAEARFRQKGNTFSVEGGRDVSQFNPDNPISYLLNSITTLFFEQNFAKIYQKDYLKLSFQNKQNNDHFTINAFFEYADRLGLNNTDKTNRYRWINWRKRDFTDNFPGEDYDAAIVPYDEYLPATHLALTAGISASYKPWQKYKIRNGKTTYYKDDSPEFSLAYRSGILDLFGSQADFNFIQVKFRHGFQTGIKSKLYYQVAAGKFFGSEKIGFQDFHHFAGNRFFFQFGDPVSTFRMLDYYRFSTRDQFAEGHLQAEFRQLLLTQIPWFRKYGIKETLLFHGLIAPQSENLKQMKRPDNYFELGYGFDIGIRFPFRIEVLSSFEGGSYKETGLRIGTTMNLPFQ